MAADPVGYALLPAHGLDPGRLPGLLHRLYRAAWALSNSSHDAEDLVQETLAKVLSRPRLLRRRDELPYLMRALRNTYLSSLRTADRRPLTVALPADESTTMTSSAAEPEAALEHRATLNAIAALPEEFRATLIAVDILGLSYREAGRALRTREATVASRLYRARQRVAYALSREGFGRGRRL